MKIDKYGSSYWEVADFKYRYEEARLEWLKAKAEHFERDSTHIADLLPFIRTKSLGALEDRIIRYSSVLPDLIFRITRIDGLFDFCFNKKTNSRVLPIKLKKMDRKGTDMAIMGRRSVADPTYENRNDGNGGYALIHSVLLPRSIELHYIKEPNVFDIIENPSGFTEESRAAQDEILDIAIKKFELTSENYNRYNAMSEEILVNNKY